MLGSWEVLDAKGRRVRSGRSDDVTMSVFMDTQLKFMRAQLYERKYPALRALEFVPLANDVPNGPTTWGYWRGEGRGQAEWIAANAQDVPRVDVQTSQVTFNIRSFALGFGYNMDEMEAAMYAGSRLQERKGNAVRRGMAEKENAVILNGDINRGIGGFLTNPAVPLYTVANGAHLGGVTTAAQILDDLNRMVMQPWLNSNQIFEANTLLLPPEWLSYYKNTPRSTTTDTSILKWFQDAHPEVKIDYLRELSTAGVSGGPRAVVYNRNPEYLECVIPLPFDTLEPETRGFEVVVATREKTGGTVWYEPFSAVYIDGI